MAVRARSSDGPGFDDPRFPGRVQLRQLESATVRPNLGRRRVRIPAPRELSHQRRKTGKKGSTVFVQLSPELFLISFGPKQLY